MIKDKKDVDKLINLSTAQKEAIKALIDRHSDISSNEERRWITLSESLELSSTIKEIDGLTDWHATSIGADVIVDSVLVYKNGSLMRGHSLDVSKNDYSISYICPEKFSPPTEVHIIFNTPLDNDDWVLAQIIYRCCIPAEVTFVDAVIDYYLKKTNLDEYVDRQILVFTDDAPELKSEI